MLMFNVKFHSQVVVWFGRSSLLKCFVWRPKIAKNSLKTPILGFKVVQGHRCWHFRKVVSSACYYMQQVCVHLQPFSCYIFDSIDEIACFERGIPKLDALLYGGLLERRGSKLALFKSTFNAENFLSQLSWSISRDFGAVYSWNVCRSLKSRKIHEHSLFWRFKVVQCHRCWYPRKVCQQCLIWWSASLWWKPGVSISPGLGLVPGCDRRTDRQNYDI